MESWTGGSRGSGAHYAGLGEAHAGMGMAGSNRGRVDGVGLHSPPPTWTPPG